MAFWGRAAVCLSLSFSFLVAADSGGLSARAEEPASTYSVAVEILIAQSSNVSTAHARQDPSLTLRPSSTQQQALAFSLSPDTQWDDGEILSPIPSGLTRHDIGSEELAAITWLAREYYNIADRIPTVETEGQADFVTDVAAERAAYQLAIWSFSAKLDWGAVPDGVVTRRARYLADRATASPPLTGSGPLAAVQLNLSRTAQSLEGERFVAHLRQSQPAEEDLSGALIQFSSVATGQPLRVLQTDANGNAVLDLPDDPAFVGDVRAEWRTKLPPGTILQGSSGEVILYQSLPATIPSPVMEHVSTQNLGDWFDRMTALAIDRVKAMPLVVEIFVYIVVALLMAIGVGGWWKAFRHTLPARWAAVIFAAAVAAVVGGCLLLASSQSRNFQYSWARSPDVGDAPSAEVPVVRVHQSSLYHGQNPDFFSGRCAVDDTRSRRPVTGSSWLSARGRGTGEILAMELEEPTLITRIDVVPGWFGTKENYDNTAKPQRVLVFTDSGHVISAPIDVDHTYEEGPAATTIDLTSSPLPAATHVYLQVTRIQGDARTYTAIADISLHGVPMDDPAEGADALDVQSLAVGLEEAPVCGASD